MIQYKIEPMAGNPAANKVDVTSGKWKVVAYDQGEGSVIEEGQGITVQNNIDYEDAESILASLNDKR